MIDWIHSVDGFSCLLPVVVKTSDCRESVEGRYEATFSVRSEMLAVEGKANERVAGSDSPGKDDNKMLTFGEAILTGTGKYITIVK